ncbi:cysteine-rich repeat secretory protein 9-like [Capsicum chacoense]
MASVLFLCSTQRVLVFLLPWLLILSNILVGVKAQVYFSCSMNNYTEGSNKFQSNVNRLLYRSLYNNGGDSIYTKASEGEEPDKVHGVFLCRGDVAPKDCQNCLDVATEQIPLECLLSKQVGIWYNECLVRYSNVSFATRRHQLPRLT